MPIPKRRLVPSILILLAMISLAAPPLWWSQGNPPVITGSAENNQGPANIGQAKNMVWAALQTLDTHAPAIATQIRADLAISHPDLLTIPADPKPDDWADKQKAPLLIGQLKAISAPFYTRLDAANPTWLATERITNGTDTPGSIFPWTATPDDDSNKAPATIGQLKAVFSLRFETLTPPNPDSDGDGMLDDWEVYYGFDPLDGVLSNASKTGALDDFDNDGLTNHQEFLLGTDPFNWDTNGNGVPDGHEFLYAGQFSIWPSDFASTLYRNQSEQREIVLFNDTDTPVNYSVVIPENVEPVYSYKDSLTGSVNYSWQDISSTGTRLANISNHSNAAQSIDLTNFTFPFYGNSFDRIHISSKGLITFGLANSASNNRSLPSTLAPANIIAPFWDDLSTRTIGDVYFQEQAARVIIQYENVGRVFGGTNHAYTFQVVLFEDGRIQFHYKSMIGLVNSATIGIQDSTGLSGLTIVNDSPYIVNEMAVEISPPSTFLAISPTTGTIPAHSTVVTEATFDSTNLPIGTHTATITTTHDSTVATGNPLVSGANLLVLNSPGVAMLTTPANDSQFAEGNSINLAAAAFDPDGIVKVEFYFGITKIAEKAMPPFTIAWGNAPVGLHGFTAHAIDIFGDVTVSAPANIAVFADSSGDGIPDEWKIAHGLDPNVPSDAYGDADGDRVPYLWEFYHETDPTDRADVPPFTCEVNSETGNDDPSDNIFTTVSAAVDAATASEDPYPIILVRGGIFYENVALSDKSILLLGELGSPNGPVEIRTDQNGAAMTINSASIVDGFIITHESGFVGPGVSVIGSSSKSWLLPRLINCIVRGNKAEYGAGIQIVDRDLTMMHCTVVGNEATESVPGIALNGAVIRLFNSIVFDNFAPYDVPFSQIEVGNLGCVQTTETAPSLIGDPPPVPTPGWIRMDPLLATDGFADAYSKVLDAGGAMASTRVLFDIQGQQRPEGDAVDIGADEFVPTYQADEDGEPGVNPGIVDTDGDGIPDQWEIAHELDPNAPNPATDLQAYLDSRGSSGELEVHTPLQLTP